MSRLDELLLEWEERRDRGDPAGPDTLCPHDPALRAKLVENIRLLQQFDALTAALSPAPPTDPPFLGKYEVRRVLGSGGMGVVFEGWHPLLKLRAAVKMIGPAVGVLAGGAAAARFAREMQALARLKHPHIVGVYDAGIEGGRPYLAMEFVPGETLADARERLTAAGPPAIVPLVEKVARAVEYAHTHPAGGVVHRDLKPGNILLDDTGEPRVADFGLARLLEAADPADDAPADGAADTDPGSARLTVPGRSAGGTPGYMAPEQYDDRFGPVGPAADVWALGVILYELLAGRRPFPGPKPLYEEQTTRGTAPPLTGVDRRLAAVVARCLEKEPAKRFRSAGELADALRATRGVSRRTAVLGGLGATATAAGVVVWRWPARPEDPEEAYRRAVEPHLRALAEGREVELIPGDGRLPPHRVRTTAGQVTATRGPDGLDIDSPGVTVVEFLPDVPAGDYTVTAELRHGHLFYHNFGPAGVGLVTSQFHHHGPAGHHHLFRTSAFNAHLQPDRLRAWVLSFWCLELPGGGIDSHQGGYQNVAVWLGVGPDEPPATWVTVEVSVSAVTGGARTRYRSGRGWSRVIEWPEEADRGHREALVNGRPRAAGVPFPDRSRRTVGLSVCHGHGTVGRLTVTPRPPAAVL